MRRTACVLVLAVLAACSASNDDAGPSPGADAGPSDTTDGGTTLDEGGGTTPGLASVSARWNIDLENPVDENVDAEIYDIDLWDNLESGLIARLHDKGRKVVCYFSAGSGEDWRPDYAEIPAAALGSGLDGWPGEKWLDTRDEGVRSVMRARLERAKEAGCDGVDPDNVDGYANESGFELTAATQLDFNRFLATEAHARGLAVGLKNDVEQVGELVTSFDFAVNESCAEFDECETVAAFTRAGKGVLHIEYGDIAAHQQSVCPATAALSFFTILSAADRLDGTFTTCR